MIPILTRTSTTKPNSVFGVESITADGYHASKMTDLVKDEIDNTIRKAVETDVEHIQRIYNATMVDSKAEKKTDVLPQKTFFLSPIQKGEI